MLTLHHSAKVVVLIAALALAPMWRNLTLPDESEQPSPGFYSDPAVAALVAKRERKPLLVAFLNRTCGPCTAYRKGVFLGAEFRQATRNMVLASVDVTGKPSLAAKFGVRSTPEIRIYAPSGRGLSRISGFDRARLFAIIRSSQDAGKSRPRG